MSDLRKELESAVTPEDDVSKLGKLIESSLDNVAGGFDDFNLVNSHLQDVQVDLDDTK